jgi:hypothetical protein
MLQSTNNFNEGTSLLKYFGFDLFFAHTRYEPIFNLGYECANHKHPKGSYTQYFTVKQSEGVFLISNIYMLLGVIFMNPRLQV